MDVLAQRIDLLEKQVQTLAVIVQNQQTIVQKLNQPEESRLEHEQERKKINEWIQQQDKLGLICHACPKCGCNKCSSVGRDVSY